MKKLLLIAGAVVAMTMAACNGNETSACGTNDSISTDSVVDTTLVDSVAIDSIALD